jgi:hypothetical protein
MSQSYPPGSGHDIVEEGKEFFLGLLGTKNVATADDPAALNAKPGTSSPSSTVTAMYPMCNSVVEMDASSAFNAANNRMWVREQLRFCENHRRKTARREWSQRHHPSIAWDLDDRLARCHPRLRRILDDPGYRSRVQECVA